MAKPSETFARLERAVWALLAAESTHTPESIRAQIAGFQGAPAFAVSREEAELLARLMEERLSVTMGLGSTVSDGQFEPWLDAARASIDPFYWQRYGRLLTDLGWSPNVIHSLDQTTDRVLSLMGDPTQEERWDRRGMVVGHVQSGKTAHYVGLMCKAADAGYKLIVIIAGLHNNLRNQTQRRVDEGFVGRDSAKLGSGKTAPPVGVGKFDSSRPPVTFTTSLRDFNKNTATTIGVSLKSLNVPAVLVVKKNPSTLGHLLEWLRDNNVGTGTGQIDFPMLVVDDEADNASINVAYDRDEVSRINGLIRSLLHQFSRSSYVGYTATPFANIFIDPDSEQEMLGDDLFPRHFIKSLDPPSHYFGPQRVFSGDGGAVRTVRDNEDSLPVVHKIAHAVTHLPGSLLEALRVFILARAIRLVRGDAPFHSSMLVNVSRFTVVQDQVATLLHGALKTIAQSAKVYGALPEQTALADETLENMKLVWEREFATVAPNWHQVQLALNEAASAIRVVQINNKSSDTLDYHGQDKNGLHVVAVGGLSLSRGLTLEGLTVSYLLRNSRMYDTLLQMGRWFGYRTGYEDICRLYMTDEMEGWYIKIAEAAEGLRQELREMEASGASPEQFGLKVRAHPEALMITARNKMGAGTSLSVRVGLSNEFIETATLKGGRSTTHNLQVARQFLDALARDGHGLGQAVTVTGGELLTGVPVDLVLQFLSAFDNHDASVLTSTGPVMEYIRARMEDELHHWDVLLTSTHQDGSRMTFHFDGTPRACQRRTTGTRTIADTIRITNKQRVASRGVERTGVPEEDAHRAERKFEEQHPEAKGANGRLNYPDRIYRMVRPRPLFILHHLEVLSHEGGARLYDHPLAAWGISFPRSRREEELTTYVVNRTWYDLNFGRDDEGGGDDDNE